MGGGDSFEEPFETEDFLSLHVRKFPVTLNFYKKRLLGKSLIKGNGQMKHLSNKEDLKEVSIFCNSSEGAVTLV